MSDSNLQNQNVEKRNREQEELLRSYQADRGEKRRREIYQVSNNDEVISREETSDGLSRPPCNPQTVINVTVDKASSSRYGFGRRRDVPVTRRERPKSYPYSTGDHNVVGIEEDVQKLVQQLINPQSGNYFAIVGMGGSGKTTLARKIYNHKKISQSFDCRAWICVSQVWSAESILRDIFSQLTDQKMVSFSDLNFPVTKIVKDIHELLADKLYLVVVDDVWESDTLMKVMVPIAKSHGSKFVITTRNQKVISFSDLDFSKHEPRRLTNDQSFELLEKIAVGHQNNTIMSHTNAVDLAKKMLEKCDGLPLAVISLAGLLRSKNIQEWMKIGNNVSSNIFKDHVGPSDYGRVEDILGLSYSDLNYILKSCFMYLSLFPEDAKIPCGVLMRCWIAEGFFKSLRLEADESIEDVAKDYLDKLIQRCLVQVVRVNYAGDAKIIIVHDLLRDLAIKRARANRFSDIYSTGSTHMSTMKFLRLSISSIERSRTGVKLLHDLGFSTNRDLSPTVNQDKVARRLRSFVFYFPYQSGGIYLRTIFTNYPLLRVLILDFLDDNKISDAIGSLIHLRFLRLKFRYIVHLPDSIQNLRNLLSFNYRIESYFHDSYKGLNLPDSIRNLRNMWSFNSYKVPNLKQMKELRYLRLPWNSNLKLENEHPQVHDLRSLKVLWGIPSGKWIMTELKYLSPTVEKLGINCIGNSEQLEQVYECPSIAEDNLYSLNLNWEESNAEFEVQKLEHCSKLNKLSLRGKIAATCLPFVFPPYLLKLVLGRSRLDDQDSFAHALQTLTYLKVLIIESYAYVAVDLTFPVNSLLYLETLELSELEYLKRIHVMEGAMPHLKSFKVNNCFVFKVLWGIRPGKWMMRGLENYTPRVYRLGIIDIKNSEELDQVYQYLDKVKDYLYTLKLQLKTHDTKFELQKIEHCTKLNKLYLEGEIAVTDMPFVFPPNLLKLALERSGLDDQHSFVVALKRLTHLKVLRLTYDAYVGAHLIFPANSLLNLEKLQLYHLQDLERIIVMKGAMPNLQDFQVDLCHKLKVIPQSLGRLVRRIDVFYSDDDHSDYEYSDEEEDEDDMFYSDDEYSEEDEEVNENRVQEK